MDWRFISMLIIAEGIETAMTALFRKPMLRCYKRMKETGNSLKVSIQEIKNNVRLVMPALMRNTTWRAGSAERKTDKGAHPDRRRNRQRYLTGEAGCT
jgi:hypothetical protein